MISSYKDCPTLTCLFSGVFLCTSFSAFADDIDRPNVLIIQTDDMGFDDLGINGQMVFETPSMDRLGQESVRFQNFIVQSLSAPTRASFLTGRHFWRTGVSGVHGGRDFMNLDEKTIAEFFKEAGYETAMWGKWHSGKTDGYYPWQRGFDTAYMAKLYCHARPSGVLNGNHLSFDGKWSDEVCADFAIDFIKRRTDKSKPFFAYVPFLSPHGLWDAPESVIEKYRKKGCSEDYATLAAQIDFLDTQIGRILDSLKETGLDDNTIVLFMSDNGPIFAVQQMKLSKDEWELRNPNHARGNKGTNWKNGVHVPLFIRYGNKYKSGDNYMNVSICDILPTLAELCSVPLNNAPHVFDGISFAENIDADSCRPETIPFENARKVFFTQWSPIFCSSKRSPSNASSGLDSKTNIGNRKLSSFVPLSPEFKSQIRFEDQMIGVVRGRFKLLMNMPGEDPLFLTDITTDLCDSVNMIVSYPAVAEELYEDARSWFNDVFCNEDCFNMPEFQIGIDGCRKNEVLAYSPSRISSGLTNNSHELFGFQNQGEYAEYKIKIHTPGIYEVTFFSKDKLPCELQFQVELISPDSGRRVCSSTYSNDKKCFLSKGTGPLVLRITQKSSTMEEFGLVSISMNRIQ